MAYTTKLVSVVGPRDEGDRPVRPSPSTTDSFLSISEWMSACWSSSDSFEMAEAEALDSLRLDRRNVLVGLVGTKRLANDGAGGAAALGLTDEHGDGFRDIVRIRGVLAFEPRPEGLEHGVGDLADFAV